MTVNFEGRRFEDSHQAPSLAGWCGAGYWDETCIAGMPAAAGSSKDYAGIGDWIIRGADGTVRIEAGGNQDGYCTDCGKPVWWQDSRLVTRSGLKWCQGRDGAHEGMTHWHVLPGMDQYVVRSANGNVCRCLDWPGPHLHEIITVPPDRAHRLARARAEQGNDILADLRADDGHVRDNHRAEAERRLWELLEREQRP
jgi:hypothetical protein